LTEEELKLIEIENETFLKSFYHGAPAVPKAEFILSKSDSKYVDGVAWRKTLTIQNHRSVLKFGASLEKRRDDEVSTVSNKTNNELLPIKSRSRKVTIVS